MSHTGLNEKVYAPLILLDVSLLSGASLSLLLHYHCHYLHHNRKSIEIFFNLKILQ